jgi:DNA (cytosine-5)-methyltransferase 1
MGYSRAGFEVVGVDLAPQPNYPFPFVQADALTFIHDNYARHGMEVRHFFDAIHASPPCQRHVKGLAAMNKSVGRAYDHVDLISNTRELLSESGLPYVIENVQGAPLLNPVRLCGSSFRLPLRRHRLFESNVPLLVPPCDHSWQTERKYWNGDRSVRQPDGTRKYGGEHRRSTVVQIYGTPKEAHEWPAAMDIDWMTPEEMVEAIPPAYTECLGVQLLALVSSQS